MRIVHTADWHLGHTLHRVSREREHARFLKWLLELLGTEAADALIIAGDVFETANPPATAQAAFFGFLAEARRRYPALDLLVVGGNHDSAARLDAPSPVLDAMGVAVRGGVTRDAAGEVEIERLLVPLSGADGSRAWCVAMPYLRPGDLPKVEGAEDRFTAGLRALYERAFEAARAARPDPTQEALIATGHLFMRGGSLSDDSERKIHGGHQHPAPVDIFPDDCAYVALGHLHLAQAVGQCEHVRYAGSPIPLSLAEASYPHQVLVVELEGPRLAAVTPRYVPQTVEMLRLPEAPPDEVLARLGDLEPLDAHDPELERPFLEVRVRLEEPRATLKSEVEAVLEGKAARLLKLAVSYELEPQPLSEAEPGATLRDLKAEEVFRRCYERRFDPPAPDELVAAFHELVAVVHAEEGE